MYTLGNLHELLHAADATVTLDEVVQQAITSAVNRTGNAGQISEHTRVSHASAETIATALDVTGW